MINKHSKVLNIGISITSLLVSIFVLLYAEYAGYELFFLLPLGFFCLNTLCFNRILFKGNTSFFAYAVVLIFFIRYVAYPFLVVISKAYDGRGITQPRSESYVLAILIMLYELVVCSTLLCFLELKFQKKNRVDCCILENKSKIKVSFNAKKYLGVYIYILLALVYLSVDRGWLDAFYFINYEDSNLDVNLGFSSVVFLTLKSFIFVLLTCLLVNRIKRLRKSSYLLKLFYISIIFLICLINGAITMGLNRMRIVMTIVASIFTVKHIIHSIPKKYLLIAMTPLLAGVLVTLNSVKEARNYVDMSEYSTSYRYASTIQVYLGGVHNVALSTEIKDYFPESGTFEELIFDCFRSIIGVNFILKHSDIKFTNEYFNQRIFLDDHMSQILPMVGHGYHFFGFLLAPIFEVIFIFLAYILLRRLYKQNNPFLTYFLSLVIFRLSIFPGQNIGNFTNFISIYLLPALLVLLVNNLLYKKK